MISCSCVYVVNGIDPATMEETHPEIYNVGPTEEMDAAYLAEVDKFGGLLPWTGRWPGDAECEEFGFYSYFGHVETGEPVELGPASWGKGKWIQCGKDTPGAGADLNRLYAECRWDKNQRKWVRA